MEKMVFNINGRNYSLRPANFFETKQHFTSLLSVAKKAVSMQENTLNIDIGQLVANVGGAEFSGVENFILAYASVFDDEGKERLLKSRAEAEMHFNANRNDYIPLIIEGLKYHFLDFLPDTTKSLMSMQNLVAMGA
ncbi:phage tail assembly chaperone [Campylobacter mucosalis]|uniref:phage tail assembly chaperone n=1 Tax=Campylobacter mucosalis TaxID=202 RepID=UPI00201E5398|nr:putative phage tail assembly chaperone [Campylobacter mucosalis]